MGAKAVKPPIPTHPRKRLLTRAEFGEAVYQAVKAEIESRGYRLWAPKFDPNYPCSLRTLGNIRNGIYDIETLRKLPGVKVEEYFTIETI